MIELELPGRYELEGHMPQDVDGEPSTEMDSATQVHEMK